MSDNQISEHDGREGERFAPLERSSLSQRAYEEIRRYLMRGRLKPGERLVSRTLASELGISTTPVREALFRLASEQALVLDHRNTVMVPDLTRRQYQEIRDIRMELEGMAAERAAQEAAPADIDRLARLQHRHLEAQDADNLEEALALNEEFHFALCRLSRLPVLVRMIEGLWLQCGPTLNHFYAGRTQVWARAEHPHFKAIACLRDRDGAGARAAMAADIDQGARPILAALKA